MSLDTVNDTTPARVIPIVMPATGDPRTSGKIKYLQCAPQVTHSLLISYEDEEQGRLEYGVEPKAARKGVSLLRDLFEAEGDHAGWAKLQRCMKTWGKHGAIPFPDAELPKEVLRRRACAMATDAEVVEETTLKRGRKAKAAADE